MAATRLPGKPLLKIGGTTIISRVYKKALETKIGEVFVATEDQEIFDQVIKEGGKSILTSKLLMECFSLLIIGVVKIKRLPK